MFFRFILSPFWQVSSWNRREKPEPFWQKSREPSTNSIFSIEYHRIVDTGILTIDLKGQIKSFNRAATEITGFSFRNIGIENYPTFFASSSAATEFEIDGKRSLIKTRFETSFLTGDKRRVALGGSVSPLKDPSGVLIGNIIVFQDLTAINERKSLWKKQKTRLHWRDGGKSCA